MLKLRGKTEGYFGTMRPQVLFNGPHWSASYHTQPHMMASRNGHRSSVAVKFGSEGSNATVHVINASRKTNELMVSLTDKSDSVIASKSMILNGSAGVFIKASDLITTDINPGIYRLSINSKHPTRKHIINRMSDGALSADHFPN
ncbi:hypothetical protein N9W44_02600 [Alphaproteobacteria bacterium]|nr:hypothetical protein [Alphaproteobacteria bacterium]